MKRFNKHIRFTLFGMSLLLVLPACSIHQLDIQQGNVITKDMKDKLKIGMDKEQIRFILGTPLINDPFHKDRWDYVYSLQKDSGEKELAHVTVMFKDNKAVQYVGVDVQAGSKVAAKETRKDNKPKDL